MVNTVKGFQTITTLSGRISVPPALANDINEILTRLEKHYDVTRFLETIDLYAKHVDAKGSVNPHETHLTDSLDPIGRLYVLYLERNTNPVDIDTFKHILFEVLIYGYQIVPFECGVSECGDSLGDYSRIYRLDDWDNNANDIVSPAKVSAATQMHNLDEAAHAVIMANPNTPPVPKATFWTMRRTPARIIGASAVYSQDFYPADVPHTSDYDHRPFDIHVSGAINTRGDRSVLFSLYNEFLTESHFVLSMSRVAGLPVLQVNLKEASTGIPQEHHFELAAAFDIWVRIDQDRILVSDAMAQLDIIDVPVDMGISHYITTPVVPGDVVIYNLDLYRPPAHAIIASVETK